MKLLSIVFFVCLLFCYHISYAETDTLYSEPMLDGKITTRPNGSLITNGTDMYFEVGDQFEWIHSYEELFRGYISFYIDSLPKPININTAILYIDQYRSIGDDVWGVFPQWTGVPGGDTLYCLLDHINYGSSIDTLDWSAGDPGDPQTITNRFGVISSSPDTGWKVLDVTSCIVEDMAQGRNRTQFRIRFPILTDHDGRTDCLYFASGNDPYNAKPFLVINYVNGISGKPIENHLKVPNRFSLCYPIPFSTISNVDYSIKEPCVVKIEIFSITGKRVRKLINAFQNTGKHQLSWDGKNDQGIKLPNGVYLLHFKAGAYEKSQKTIILK